MVEQLLIKTLHFAGELTGYRDGRAARHELPVDRAGRGHAEDPAPRRDRRRDDPRAAVVPAIASRRWAASTRACSSTATCTRHRARAARLQYLRYMTGFFAKTPHTVHPDQVRDAFSHLVLSDQRARPARPGRERGPLAVRLRPSRQRQDRHLAGDPQPARRRHLDSARDRRRRQHHPRLRSRQPRRRSAAGAEGDVARSDAAARIKPLDPVPASARHRRRRADARARSS